MVQKKGNPFLAAILKKILEVIKLSVYIFGKFRLFYVSEEIVEKDTRMSLYLPNMYTDKLITSMKSFKMAAKRVFFVVF